MSGLEDQAATLALAFLGSAFIAATAALTAATIGSHRISKKEVEDEHHRQKKVKEYIERVAVGHEPNGEELDELHFTSCDITALEESIAKIDAAKKEDRILQQKGQAGKHTHLEPIDLLRLHRLLFMFKKRLGERTKQLNPSLVPAATSHKHQQAPTVTPPKLRKHE